jgi:hypothetical protein
MAWMFNPFTGTFDITGGGSGGSGADNEKAVIMLETAIVEGELIVEDEGEIILKNSLADAFQKIVEQVTINGNGEISVDSIAGLEVSNG